MRAIIRNEVLRSDLTAIADDKGNRITYKGLADKAERLSCHIEERSLIFCLCDHQTECIEFIYEALYLNRVLLLLEADIDGELLEHLIDVYQPQYIYCRKSRHEGGRYEQEKELGNHVLLRTGMEKCKMHQDVALLLSTSGTTGSAKLVKLSYDNLYSAAEHAALHMGIKSGQKGICPAPVNHVLGFIFCLWHWHQGATLLVTEELPISNRFREFYVREKVNNFAATPYIYRMLQKVRFWDEEKAQYLHCAIAAGERMPEEDQEEMAALVGAKFWVAYGQTECAGYISSFNIKRDRRKKGSVGQALAHMETATDGETNELIVTSKSVCMGYASNRDQLEEGDVNQGVLHTGDIAFIDEDGFIYLGGRLKRCIKILGKLVNLDDIENYLKSKFLDADFACTGTDNELVIFRVNGQRDSGKEVLQLLDLKMKIPAKFVSCIDIERMPRNESGKIAYARLVLPC